MEFKEKELESFLKMFEQKRDAIRAFPGCMKVCLFQQCDRENVCFTYSHWTSAEALEKYRNSDFFKETWAETKAKFSAPAEAWSVNQY